MSRIIETQHCILVGTARLQTSRPVYDLFEVTPNYTVAADTEFPTTVNRFDLFLRLLVRHAGPTRVRVRVRHQKRRGQWDIVNDFRPNRLLPFPTNQTVYFDQSIRLPYVTLAGEGWYAVSVYFRPSRTTWERAAVEYFRVVKAT